MWIRRLPPLVFALAAVWSASPAMSQTGPVRIVVLGSSNAFGTGPRSQDSTWVNRFRVALAESRPGSEVINRARGGYLTYHLMPSDYTPPAGRQLPDPERNITRALADDPDAIIVSLTSNDADLGYAPLEQLDRYDAMQAAAGAVPVYFTTPTPRSYWRDNGRSTRAEKRKIQAVLKDSTLARYGDRAIDFWADLATGDSIPAPAYSSGDGVHFNDAGHRILFQRVASSTVATVAVASDDAPDATGLRLRPAPNPSPSKIDVTVGDGRTQLDVFDLHGRHVHELLNGPMPGGQHRVALGELAAGLYIVRLR